MTGNKELSNQFHQIIEQHKGILFKVARAYCPNKDDRQDLLQEMMIQVWKSLHRYNDNFAISTWLYRISLNVAISFFRKTAKRQTVSLPMIYEDKVMEDDSDFERQEQLRLLEKFISELNKLDKALVLLYLDDKSHAEISEILGLSVSNVGTKMGRIKERLRNKFSKINS